jgi:hypothetical protein
MAQRVESNPLEAAYATLLSQGLDGAGEALRIRSTKPPRSNEPSILEPARMSARASGAIMPTVSNPRRY